MMMAIGSSEPNTVFHQIMETLTEGIAITNARGQIAFANQALEQMLGYKPAELVGQSWTVLFAGTLQENRRAMPGRQETRLLHKRGYEIPVVTGSFALSDGDRDAGNLTTFTDMRDPCHALVGCKDGAAPATSGQRIASVVHELNNSLSILTLQAQMIHKKAPLAPGLRESVTAIQDEALRMAMMVESLRLAAADPYDVHLQPTDINALVARTLELQEPLLEQARVCLDLDLDPDLPPVQADPLRLQQVFVNLINNTRQAFEGSPDGGRLVIGTGVVDIGDGASCVQVRFVDDGPGIPPHVMPHIFEPFYTTKTGNGMGLGLPICKQIIEKHAGRIWVEENHPSGAVLILELPLVEECPCGDRRPASFGKRHPHILVVDDEPEVARFVGEFLEQEGFTVTTATGARKALTLLDRTEVDLIISDLSMPRMSGRQFWTQVRERKPDLARRIIFSTGDSSGRKSLAFLQSTGCAWIEKPFKPDELLRLIAQRLSPDPDTTSHHEEIA